MKDRRIKVIVSDAGKYNELTGAKKKVGDLVAHEIIEIDELNKLNCVKLSPLQEKLLARKITKQEETKIEVIGMVHDLLVSVELLPKLIAEVQKFVAGEQDTILTIGLNACGRLVINASRTSYNIIPNDESGTGKDFTTENTLKTFVPENCLIIRTRISPKVMNYWHNSKFEPDFTWDGQVLSLKDVSDDVLNSEVMKTFTSDDTKATILIKQMACDLEIRGKPCLFATTANSTPGVELIRRFWLVPLDSSVEQTKRIKSFHAKRAVSGTKPERDKIIADAMKALERVSVTVPFADLLADKFPDVLITRTVFGTFIDLIKASAALHQFQREKDSRGFVVATFQDYGYARDALIKITAKSGLIPVTKTQRKLLDLIDFELDENTKTGGKDGKVVKEHSFWAVEEIEEKVNFLNKANLYINLGILANYGFLKKGEKEIVTSTYETNDGTRSSSKNKIAYCLQEQVEFKLPDKETLQAEWELLGNTNNNSNTLNISNTYDTSIASIAGIAKNCNVATAPIQKKESIDWVEPIVERDFCG